MRYRMNASRDRLRPTSIAVLAALAIGCGAETASKNEAEIVDGRRSGRAQDWAVLMGTHYLSGSGAHMASPVCTGTLVAENLVLTALHCLGDANYDEYAGDSLGGSSTCAGGVQKGDIGDYRLFEPDELWIKIGNDLSELDYKKSANIFSMSKLNPEAFGAEIVVPDDECLLGSDVAFLILDRPVKAPILPLRTDPPAACEDGFMAVGWGDTDNGATADTTIRLKRTSLSIEGVGPERGYGARGDGPELNPRPGGERAPWPAY